MTGVLAGGYGPCATHPDSPSVATCQRCGNFMCDACSARGLRSLCPACIARTGAAGAFPLTRDSWNLEALWDLCWGRFKVEWKMLVAVVVVSTAISFGLGMLQEVLGMAAGRIGEEAVILAMTAAAQILQIAVSGALQLGLNRVSLDVLGGRQAQIPRLLSQLHKIWRYIALLLMLAGIVLAISGPLVALGIGGTFLLESLAGLDWQASIFLAAGPLLILGMVPLVYFCLPFSLAFMELPYTEASALESLRRAYRLARGQRLRMLGIHLLVALVQILGVVLCCIGVIPAIALGQLLIAGLYLALRNGSGLPDPQDGSA